MRAVVTGATGFIGRQLLARLDRPIVLTRRPDKARQTLASYNAEVFGWDAEREPAPAAAFDGADVVFHLAGESVAEGRWNAEKKRRIRESRELSTRNLVQGLRSAERRPAVLVSTSAVGYYGSRGEELLDESSAPAQDFLAEVCQVWEREAQAAREFGVRVANPRIGLVLGRGGALEKMLPPFKLGVGGRLGDGRAWMPWIHVDDVVGIFLHAAQHAAVSGPINAVSPNPVRNAEFTKELAAVLHRPAVFPVPGFGLKLMFGEFAQVLLASQRVVPKVAEQTGYRFAYPTLAAALAQILAS
ncbi:MAG: TIGR01777 family oxidoreductase [Pirellulales bacterium]